MKKTTFRSFQIIFLVVFAIVSTGCVGYGAHEYVITDPQDPNVVANKGNPVYVYSEENIVLGGGNFSEELTAALVGSVTRCPELPFDVAKGILESLGQSNIDLNLTKVRICEDLSKFQTFGLMFIGIGSVAATMEPTAAGEVIVGGIVVTNQILGVFYVASATAAAIGAGIVVSYYQQQTSTDAVAVEQAQESKPLEVAAGVISRPFEGLTAPPSQALNGLEKENHHAQTKHALLPCILFAARTFHPVEIYYSPGIVYGNLDAPRPAMAFMWPLGAIINSGVDLASCGTIPEKIKEEFGRDVDPTRIWLLLAVGYNFKTDKYIGLTAYPVMDDLKEITLCGFNYTTRVIPPPVMQLPCK